MPPRRRPKFTGLFHDEVVTDSYWIRETGALALPPLRGVKQLSVIGELRPAAATDATSAGEIGLLIALDGCLLAQPAALPAGPFRFDFALPVADSSAGHVLALDLTGVRGSNLLAWLGRVTGLGFLQPWRAQARNRRLRLQRVEADGEVLFDFANRAAPWNTTFARRFLKLGVNLVGWFRADLGLGESVRCMARAAAAAGINTALVDLRLPCKNSLSDDTFTARLSPDHPYPVNVFHLDPPGMRDLDHHHGAGFRRGKYNIGYWAWELPEFPDAWIHFADYCDEVWAPSRFAAEAIAQKVPVPVLTMPHAIAFARPEGDCRPRFGLPADQFLFLYLYDLNSYSERKNPAAVLEAFRRAGLAGHGAALVIKVHNVPGNPADFERLRAAAASLPGTVLITQTLSRQEIYELESACDCFVSLHRSEGFGLAIAESMYLGKPVISTDWSGTAEFVHAGNGCPVRCTTVTLDRNHGPYAKGQTWAEPDIDHAAEWMRRLHDDRDLGRRLGAAARATIERDFSPAAIGARYRRRLEAIAGW
ncbi:MAG: glycosyltransferase family 4 protein [bacterium]|nr:glycosyltransferase family 4 protein [bacterium]MDI1334680.1 glycosyltransferase family 4 protein [Lacunisphaera sp.]